MPEDVPPALAENLGYLLGQAHLVHRQTAQGEFSSLGLRPKEFGSLSVLVSEGAMSQRRLGERTGLDRTTMVAVADGLERKGFAERQRNAADRRAYVLRPTAKGRRVLKRATAAAARAEEQFLAAIPAAERPRLKKLLRQLISQ
jgi:DNA-binding MarR family transcriptional regulator